MSGLSLIFWGRGSSRLSRLPVCFSPVLWFFLVCLVILFTTGTLVLQVPFGKSCVSSMALVACFHRATIHRRMGRPRGCIGPSSRLCVVCWQSTTCLRVNGVLCWPMLSWPSTVVFLSLLAKPCVSWFLVSGLFCRLTLLWVRTL